jgi:integrase
LKISDGKKALNGACERLGYPAFTQRALRRAFITRAIELGLDFKVIAQTQGHSDGGVLVVKTYGHLRQEHLEAMAAKLV